MQELIYIVEDYDSGDMIGYWSKEEAIRSILNYYLDSGFGHMTESIVKAAKEGKVDEINYLLDTIKEDFRTLFGDGHYIDCLMGVREVEIKD